MGSRLLGGGRDAKRSRRRAVHRQVEFFDNGWQACLHPGDTRSQRHPGKPREGNAAVAAAGKMTNGSTSACLQCFLSASFFFSSVSTHASWRFTSSSRRESLPSSAMEKKRAAHVKPEVCLHPGVKALRSIRQKHAEVTLAGFACPFHSL